MLKRSITYTDFNNQEITKEFYFNLSKAELLEMEVTFGGDGLGEALQRIVAAKDTSQMFLEWKRFVLASYGVKSDDGETFVKSDDLRNRFEHTAAYQALIFELSTDDNAAAVFINGIMPGDFLEKANASLTQTAQPLPVNPNLPIHTTATEAIAQQYAQPVPTTTEAIAQQYAQPAPPPPPIMNNEG